MIYESEISTGDVSISGCFSSYLHTDTFESGNLRVAGAMKDFFYDIRSVTGQRAMKLSTNGQTLLQEIPITGATPNYIDYQVNTGDFFIKGGEANIADRSELYFDSSTPVKSSDILTYNVITGGNFVGTGDFGLSLKSGISGEWENSNFTDFNFFLNGQKVYSGVGIGVSAGTDGVHYIPSFGTAVGVGGIVTNDNKDRFKYTAYRKEDRVTSITGDGGDVFSDTGFIEGRTIFYINGLQQLQNNYLELYTGVIMIKSGVPALLSGGLPVITQTNSLTL